MSRANAARDAAATQLQLTLDEEIFDGGSTARVFRARRPDGAPVVLKVVAARAGTVDGHDLDSFRGKEAQQNAACRVAPRLGARYLPIIDSIHSPDWAAQVIPYFPSVDLAAPLRDDGTTDAFFTRYGTVAVDLFAHGYGAVTVPAPADFLDQVVIGRFFRRFDLLEQAMPELAGADTVIVNGRSCVSPRPLLRNLRTKFAGRLRELAPPRLGFGAHGDANTRNVLFSPDGEDYRLIDPRGSTAPWDPVYDLAKAVFSLSVWDSALRRGCIVQPSTDSATPEYRVGFRGASEYGYRSAVLDFLPFLAGLPALHDIFDDDPWWKARLLLTHDMHVLAEAACRLSDDKPRVGADGLPTTPSELAMCHYLLGTLLLNDLAAQLDAGGDLDAGRHFGELPL